MAKREKRQNHYGRCGQIRGICIICRDKLTELQLGNKAVASHVEPKPSTQRYCIYSADQSSAHGPFFHLVPSISSGRFDLASAYQIGQSLACLEPSLHLLDVLQVLFSPEILHSIDEPPTHLLDFGLVHSCETDSEVRPTSLVPDFICRSK